ncbi:MAG: SDR family NAD(P)-dependent oxidoreductase, partial [Epsilonproteobacteria bacterium]|nr:SDR family NAD(P)-dependent oxidoreductase [Campylobacterota bacterium]
ITGGSSGIGLELVKQLISTNHIIVISKDQHKIQKLVLQFPNIDFLQADLSKSNDVLSVIKQIYQRYQKLDILINCAAIQYTPLFTDETFTFDSIANEIDLNFTSVCQMNYLLLDLLTHEHRSTILNINSGLGLVPKKSAAIYCGTKGALNIFSQSLRYQLEDTNIAVQQVFLPLVDTPMTQGRDRHKIHPKKAAREICKVLELEIDDYDIGKVKFLRLLMRIAPSISKKMMKKY